MTNYSEPEIPKLELTLRIADSFCEENPGIVFCLEEEVFYLYENGLYRKIFTREMQEMVLDNKSQVRGLTLQTLKNIVDRIATNNKARLIEFNSGEYANFNNGLFYFGKREFKEHSTEAITTIRIPYIYDPKAECPLWLKSLDEILENDKNKLRTIQEFFGYCLTRTTEMEKCLILTGEGANGKSTILNTLQHMVGSDNCSFLSLRYFNDPQKVSAIKGKMVNICGEVPKKIEDYEAEFRTIVTGESIQVSPKHVQDYNITPFCKLIFAVNEFPHIDDKTSAFYRRLLIIPLERQFSEEEQNKNLRTELLEELPGIFNWSLQGLTTLKARGTFIIDEYMKKAIQEVKEGNNPIIQWCLDNVSIIKGAELLKGQAFDDYKEWSVKNGYRPYGAAKFSVEVYKHFNKHTEKDRRLSSATRAKIWPNLSLLNPINQEPEVDWRKD